MKSWRATLIEVVIKSSFERKSAFELVGASGQRQGSPPVGREHIATTIKFLIYMTRKENETFEQGNKKVGLRDWGEIPIYIAI